MSQIEEMKPLQLTRMFKKKCLNFMKICNKLQELKTKKCGHSEDLNCPKLKKIEKDRLDYIPTT